LMGRGESREKVRRGVRRGVREEEGCVCAVAVVALFLWWW
jgi:hypothetical protein